MTTTSNWIPVSSLARSCLPLPAIDRVAIAHRRLDQVLGRAPRVPFDDDSRIVLLSDCHRGDGGPTDAFAPNERLFCSVLQRYNREAFSYVEVGDGDELWHNRQMADICAAHPRAFELLHQLDRHSRLHLLLGNHDLHSPLSDQIEKDGLVAHEGLVLEHAVTGQQIFVVHGHQADLKSDALSPLSRLLIRKVWRPLQRLGLGHHTAPDTPARELSRPEAWLRRWVRSDALAIEDRIRSWLVQRRQVTICGHTHLPASAAPGAPPYFNTGSCTVAGQLSGLEIDGGWITPVRWLGRPSPPDGDIPRTVRQCTGPSRRLATLS
ncbi:MAG: metallophosphoesterase [Anaerolineae bacterium]